MHIIALTTGQLIMAAFTAVCLLALAALAGYAVGEVRGGLVERRAGQRSQDLAARARNLSRRHR